jgi:hypothetical protein
MQELRIEFAKIEDANIVLEFIKRLAEYEKLSDQVSATKEGLKKSLFAENSNAEALIL